MPAVSPGRPALGIKAAAVKDGHWEPNRGLLAKPLLPVGDGPLVPLLCSRQLNIQGHIPIGHEVTGPVGQTPAGTRKLVSRSSAGEAGWLGLGVTQSLQTWSEAGLLWACRGPWVSEGHVPRVACRRVKQLPASSFQLH